jgi:uncharacterized protein
MLINLSEIMSVKGKIKHIEVPFERKNFHLGGMDYDFVVKNPIDLTISNLGDRKVMLEGSTKLSILIPCSRCLEGVETFFDINLSKDLDFNETDEDRIKELDETNYIEGYNLDVDQLVYEEILIDFPMKVLCSSTCKGICNVCGANLNKEACSCNQTVGDPRMSVIRDIFNNFKEV